jgi:HK97 family phage portal protein
MQRDQDIIHIPMFLLPGQAEGRGPITAARETLTGAKAEQQLATTLAADYSAPRGVIEADARLTKDEADAILDGWEASHQGRGRLAVMGGGARFAPLGMKPIDMEFIEARKFSVQEVARLFGVPGIFLATDSGSSLTYATTESLFRMFVTSTLRPTYLERIEQAYSRLLPKGQIARFDTSELLGADMTARYAAYTQALDAGWMTPDEIRAREGLSPL